MSQVVLVSVSCGSSVRRIISCISVRLENSVSTVVSVSKVITACCNSSVGSVTIVKKYKCDISGPKANNNSKVSSISMLNY